jgi:hypothetical protein
MDKNEKKEFLSSIILNPGVNDIDAFNSKYEFYCTQVLKELHRNRVLKKVKNDSTPTKIETELQECIQTILQRFRVYDKQVPIDNGYFVQLTNELQDYEIIPIIEEDRPELKVEGELKHHVFTVKIPIDRIEDFQELLKGHDRFVTFHFDEVENDVTVANEGKGFLDTAVSHINPKMFEKKEDITVDIITFILSRTESTVDEFANMNITTEEVVKMMWADMLEDAIAYSLKSEDK